MGAATGERSPSPSFPATRMRKNRSNVHFVLDEDEDGDDAINNSPTDTLSSS
jgi:hypothetical protein